MDKRRRTAAQKATTKRQRLDRRGRQRREDRWCTAAQAAHSAGFPVNVHITVSLDGLAANELDPRAALINCTHEEQEKRLWGALRRAAERHGSPWIGLRAPEHDAGKGRHVHIAAHAPDDDALTDFIAAVERITGIKADRFDLRGFTVNGRRGVVAVSPARSWMVQCDDRGVHGNPDLIRYIAKGAGKRHVSGQHRLSDALIALVREHAHSADTRPSERRLCSGLGGLAESPHAP